MPEIHLLDALTANQIAAGEVIERPVSVVKELVENSLDAAAAKIVVEILHGGLTLIKVTDNGCGMSEKDLTLAVQSHATSKIRTITDLEHIQSLGFRGEALPSIVAVAKVEIISRRLADLVGRKLVISADQAPQGEPTGAPVGTSVVVSDLFYNTPARKKFLRSEGYESGLIHDLLIKFALSHPEVSFLFYRDGKEVLNTSGMTTYADLVEHFYGLEAKNALIEVSGKLPDGSISGMLTLPTYHRMNRKGIHFFINRRRVYAKELARALEEVYEDTLPKGQFPLCILNLQLDPATIDVNVHPSKLEVRLRNPMLAQEMTLLLKRGLIAEKKIPHYFSEPKGELANKSSYEDKSLFTGVAKPANGHNAARDVAAKEVAPPRQTTFAFQETSDFVIPQPMSPDADRKKEQGDNLALTIAWPQLKIIGQLYNTFILAEGTEGLYLIDQHVAHERIIYEALLAKTNHRTLDSQVLLQPVTLHLSLLEEETVLKYIIPLVELGIIIEHFGPRTYLLRAIPAGISMEPQDYFYSLLEHLENSRGTTEVPDCKKEILIHTSCKSAIKANTKLTLPQMEQLLKDLSKAENYLTCPHGRPIIYKITRQEILKAFHRL
jgi:DNA mismatch repair protein MutL